MKMKIAVILGVSHMSLGLFIKALNTLHFKKPVDLFFEFIPQILLLFCLFGFMDILIILKWLTPWNDKSAEILTPPSIISIMINMFLNQGKVDEDIEPLMGNANTQQIISNVFIIIAII
jgi:V-type H+-transporting ATPase subunit a